MADNQSIIGKGAIFKGKISNASTIEINGRVQADIKSENSPPQWLSFSEPDWQPKLNIIINMNLNILINSSGVFYKDYWFFYYLNICFLRESISNLS